MLYHPAYLKMKESITKGKIGKVRYIYSNRLALGKLRKEGGCFMVVCSS